MTGMGGGGTQFNVYVGGNFVGVATAQQLEAAGLTLPTGDELAAAGNNARLAIGMAWVQTSASTNPTALEESPVSSSKSGFSDQDVKNKMEEIVVTGARHYFSDKIFPRMGSAWTAADFVNGNRFVQNFYRTAGLIAKYGTLHQQQALLSVNNILLDTSNKIDPRTLQPTAAVGDSGGEFSNGSYIFNGIVTFYGVALRETDPWILQNYDAHEIFHHDFDQLPATNQRYLGQIPPIQEEQSVEREANQFMHTFGGVPQGYYQGGYISGSH